MRTEQNDPLRTHLRRHLLDQRRDRIVGVARGEAVQLVERDQVDESALSLGAGAFLLELVEDRRRDETLEGWNSGQRRQIDDLRIAGIDRRNGQRLALLIVAAQYPLAFGHDEKQSAEQFAERLGIVLFATERTAARSIRPAANFLEQFVECLRSSRVAGELTGANAIAFGTLFGQPSFEVINQRGKIVVLPLVFREQVKQQAAFDDVLEAPAVGLDIRLVPARIDGHIQAGLLRRVVRHVAKRDRARRCRGRAILPLPYADRNANCGGRCGRGRNF